MKHTVEKVTLLNGAEGLLIDVADASVMTFEFNFRAGEYLVDPVKWETPHIMEHVLLGANKLYPKARIFQAEFEKNGAYNNASTGVYDITYEAECAEFEWERILDLMVLAISQPLFLQEEFDAELGNVREELNGRANNHFRHLSLAMRKYCGYQAMTDRERLKLLANNQKNDIEEHYKKTHTTSNMRFVIAGSITGHRATIVRMLEDMQLPKGKGRIPLPLETPLKQSKGMYLRNPSVKNAYFIVDTFHLERLDEPEWDAGQLINTMLTETLYSRILGAARERGLVYSMSSGFNQLSQNVSWWFGAQVMPSNAQALFKIMIDELYMVRDGNIDEQDIEAAKQYMLGRYQRAGQTVAGTASGYTNRYFFEDIVDDYYALPERIKTVTKTRIISTTNLMFQDDVWNMGMLCSAGRPFVDELYEQLAPLWLKP
ncbi:insulinase family protein [Candidatus Saccharibacteria bacterium]|nr:insulinase family protein [Candidatus Saccharibacteria bacterium]